ncbi:Fe-S cluster assembly protein SufD [Tepiditoga spiralis]|uniref:Fe-S cluster assembly protein SufD n=1 Tax=Tepiditoga spiralis TaxID=2108365 RepID=A0A7G1G5G2_9BACT|nr:Fe-S cluster assembly protein SufD [Tepiditoga spiralis]BBE30516.1 Fe-S cluster assembly protein SufD [Tepiditoga spiralis]
MKTIFEKPINMVHKNFKGIEPEPKQIKSENDYNETELQMAIEYTENEDMKKYRKIKFEAYKKWDFPIWKRARLKGYDPLKYTPCKSQIDNIDEEGLEILSKYGFEGAHRKYLLMAETFYNTGYYIKTNENEIAETKVIQYNTETSVYENTVFNIKKNSKLTVVRVFKTKSDIFRTTALKGRLEENSELTIINVNILNDENISIDNAMFDIGKNAKIKVFDLNIGGKLAVPHYIFRLSEKNGQAEMKPYFLGNNETIIDMLYLMKFYAPDTIGKIYGKGALKDKSKVIFRGFLDLKKGAKEATADESEYTLLLSPKAKAEAIPSLLVDENEVNAAHAASVGTIEEDKLYYLMTRGFSKDEAKKLISFGIFEPVIEEIEKYHPSTAEVITNVIKSKI